MTKKIPSSSLTLILISLISLYILFWICLVIVSVLAPDTVLPHTLSVILFVVIPACLTFVITLGAVLYLKRDRPASVRQALAIVAVSVFGLQFLSYLGVIILNLLMFAAGGIAD